VSIRLQHQRVHPRELPYRICRHCHQEYKLHQMINITLRLT
jgi:hypothetical protein